MNFWKVLRKIFFLIPAEPTHSLAKVALQVYGAIVPRSKTYPLVVTEPQNFLGVLNPMGLAAGFDKNAEVLESLPGLGFGFAEIGTVTPLAQPGNEKPRLFRDPENENLFNKMGFNNWGAEVVAARLARIKPKLPPGFKVGVNIGKNKATDLTQAHVDYAIGIRTFLKVADYFVINVSSPNTPGLRALQTPEALSNIVLSAQNELKLAASPIPLLVKLAPEVTGSDLRALIEVLERLKVQGLVLTNTLEGTHIHAGKEYRGGLSGRILTVTSFERLLEARSMTKLPIISVGGVFNAEDVKKRLEAGANLVQWYSGWVFEGPFATRKIISDLALEPRLNKR